MKAISKPILCVLFCLALLGTACHDLVDRHSTPLPAGTYRGVVLRNICCQAVIQTLGDTLGQSTWTDSSNVAMPVYHYVFRVGNPCQFGNHMEGDTILFKIIPQVAQTCACCMLFTYTPSVTYPVQVIN